MDIFKNIYSFVMESSSDCNLWEGYKEAKSFAETTTIEFVEYVFNGVCFPVKKFNKMIDYIDENEMSELALKYLNAQKNFANYAVFRKEDAGVVFASKIVEAMERNDNKKESPKTLLTEFKNINSVTFITAIDSDLWQSYDEIKKTIANMPFLNIRLVCNEETFILKEMGSLVQYDEKSSFVRNLQESKEEFELQKKNSKFSLRKN